MASESGSATDLVPVPGTVNGNGLRLPDEIRGRARRPHATLRGLTPLVPPDPIASGPSAPTGQAHTAADGEHDDEALSVSCHKRASSSGHSSSLAVAHEVHFVTLTCVFARNVQLRDLS